MIFNVVNWLWRNFVTTDDPCENQWTVKGFFLLIFLTKPYALLSHVCKTSQLRSLYSCYQYLVCFYLACILGSIFLNFLQRFFDKFAALPDLFVVVFVSKRLRENGIKYCVDSQTTFSLLFTLAIYCHTKTDYFKL